jgi:nitroreductase
VRVDTYLAIASRRDNDPSDDRPLEPDVTDRILDAGRLAGSAGNRQRRRFVVVESEDARERLADAVFEPGNVRGAGLVVAIVVPDGRMPLFDAGRAAQNMLLAAWNEGIDATPNGLEDADAARKIAGIADEEAVAIVLSFGRPSHPREAEARAAAEWSARAKRKSLDELVERR